MTDDPGVVMAAAAGLVVVAILAVLGKGVGLATVGVGVTAVVVGVVASRVLDVSLAAGLLLGALVGYLVARRAVVAFNRLRLECDGLYPVLLITIVLLTYGVADVAGGNGFLAVYVAGIGLGNSSFTSVLVQGTTVAFVARRLHVDEPLAPRPASPLELVDTGAAAAALHEIAVSAGSPAAGRQLVELHLPPGALVVLVSRDDERVVPSGATVFRPGDRALVLADPPTLERARVLIEGSG